MPEWEQVDNETDTLCWESLERGFHAVLAHYESDGPQETPMSPPDTLDIESQGSSSDMAYVSEEIRVSGVLTLKEIDGRIQYSLTFSQDLLPHVLRQDNDMRSSAAPSIQGRGRAKRPNHSFTDDLQVHRSAVLAADTRRDRK